MPTGCAARPKWGAFRTRHVLLKEAGVTVMVAGGVLLLLLLLHASSIGFEVVADTVHRTARDGDRVISVRVPFPRGVTMQSRFYMLKESTHREMSLFLERIVQFLRRMGVEFFVDNGTLLGTVRHGGIIPWDDDLDLQVVDSARKDLFRWALDGTFAAAGFEAVPPADRTTLFKIRQLGQRFPFVDLSFYDKKGGMLIDASWDWPFYPLDAIYPMSVAKFEHFEVPVPNDPERVLTILYHEKVLESATETRWQMRNLPWFFNHKVGAHFRVN